MSSVYEEKRDYLSRYLVLQAKINRLKEQSLINAENREVYNKEIHKARTVRDSIEQGIMNMSNEIESEILAQKYLLGKTLEETADILNYSKRQIERLHIKALEHITIST